MFMNYIFEPIIYIYVCVYKIMNYFFKNIILLNYIYTKLFLKLIIKFNFDKHSHMCINTLCVSTNLCQYQFEKKFKELHVSSVTTWL